MRRAAGLMLTISLTVVLAIALTGCPPPKKPMANTVVKVVPSKTILAPQEPFTVDVIIDPAVAIAGAQFDLAWDKNALQVDGVAEGNLLKQSGKQTFFMAGTVDNQAGTLKGVAQVILGAGNSVSTPGTLATLTCKALTAGKTSMFALSNVVVGDPTGTAVPLASSIINQIQVALAWDFNFDGVVNLADMQDAAAVFATTGAPGWRREDVNKDGKIDVLDLILVGQNFTV